MIRKNSLAQEVVSAARREGLIVPPSLPVAEALVRAALDAGILDGLRDPYDAAAHLWDSIGLYVEDPTREGGDFLRMMAGRTGHLHAVAPVSTGGWIHVVFRSGPSSGRHAEP